MKKRPIYWFLDLNIYFIGVSFGAGEIPLPLSLFYLFDEAELDLTVQLLALRSFVG